jgi:hypothetical protein
LKLIIAEPQIMLFAGFVLYASSGPMRWVWVRGKRLRTQMRRRGRPADTTTATGPHPELGSPPGPPTKPPIDLARRQARKVGP